MPWTFGADSIGQREFSIGVACRTGFAGGCKIGWLISHSHDYIDGTETHIYIRVCAQNFGYGYLKVETRTMRKDKKKRNKTECQRTHQSSISSLIAISPVRVLRTIYMMHPADCIDWTKMFHHTGYWFILYFFPTLYFHMADKTQRRLDKTPLNIGEQDGHLDERHSFLRS